MVVGENFFVVTISGVTNGGKTSLSNRLRQEFPHVRYINQDDFFLESDDPKHVWVEFGEFTKHQNWEIKESVDFVRLKQTVTELTNCPADIPYRLLILEGHILFVDSDLCRWSDKKYFFNLTREQCKERRKNRVYDPPDPPGYFDHVVYPEYLNYEKYVKQNVNDVINLDGSSDKERIAELVIADIRELLKEGTTTRDDHK